MLNIITDLIVDDDFAEVPRFIGINFTKKLADTIKQYRASIITMKANGLDPHKITEFNYNVDLYDPTDETPKLIKSDMDTLHFISDDTKGEWESTFNVHSDDTITLDAMSSDGELNIESTMLNVTENVFWFSGYIKHTTIMISSGRIDIDDM